MTAVRREEARAGPLGRDVRRWATGLSLSLVGDQVFFIALSWTAAQVASPSAVGLVVAAGAVPRAVLMLVGGAVVDRTGPRRAALASDAARAVVMLLVALLLLVEQPSVLALAALAAVFGAVDALFLPAVGAMPASLVPPGDLARVTAVRQVVERGAAVVGTPVAGWLVATQALSVVHAVCAGLFATSVVALSATRARYGACADDGTPAGGGPGRPRDRPTVGVVLREALSGLHHVRHHQLLLPLLVLMAVAELGLAGSLNVALPLLADASGWGAQGIGWVLGAWGAAAALTSVTLAVAGPPRRAGLVGTCCLPVMGAALAAVALAPGLPGAAAAAVVLGVGSGVVAPLFGGLVLAAADPAHVGRVVSVASLAGLGSAPVAYAVTGVAVDLAGPSVPFVLGGALTGFTGLAALAVRPVRTARSQDRAR